MNGSPETPAFDAQAPQQTPGTVAMRERVSHRLFGIGTPQRIGRYVVERRLGAGGMGVVYAAVDDELSRTVAIKLVRNNGESKSEQERLRAEARSLAQLSHPNVVQIHEVGVHDEQLYLAMEYIEGRTLDVWVRDQPRVEIVRSCIEAGRGLAAAHAAGILHRDVKPNNIIVGIDGRVRVVDFGLARLVFSTPDTPPHASESEQTSHLAGTPGYLAPELFDGIAASPESDQFGFCVTMWQLLVGTRPFTSDQLAAASEGSPLRPYGVLRPRWLRRALLRGLAADPRLRWPSIDALLDELEKRPRQRRRIAAALMVCTIAGAGALAGLTSDPSTPSCDEQAADFDEVWNEGRRRQIIAHIERLGAPYADATVRQLNQTMQGHRVDWLVAHDRVCAVTQSPGRRMQLSQDLGLACLARDLLTVDEFLRSIETATPNTLERLEHQLAELGDPQHCEAFESLAARPTLSGLTAGPMLARDLDQARFALAAHDFDLAREHAEAAINLATELGHELALAEGFELLGQALGGSDRFFEAEEALVTAARLGATTDDPRRGIRARQHLTALTIEKLNDPTRAKRSLELAAALLDHVDDPSLRAEQLVARASLASHAQDHAQASELLGQATILLGQALGPSHPRVESVELRHANSLGVLGQSARAIAIYEHLLERRSARLGADHPSVAVVEFNLGVELLDADPLQAKSHIERALDVERRVYGPDSLRVAASLTMLAELYWQRGELEAAERAATQAWPVQLERMPPGNAERGSALAILAWVQLERGAYAEALTSFERLPIPSDHDEAAALALNVGWLLCRLDRWSEAIPQLQAARASENPQIRSSAEVTLAEVRLRSGEVEVGLDELDTLVAQFEALPAVESETVAAALAEARWLIARTLATRNIDDRRVRELARAALPIYQLAGWPAQTISELEYLVACGQIECE